MAVPEHRSADAGLRVETRLAVAGRPSGPGKPLNVPIVPIVPASNFRAAPDGGTGREYSRDDGTPGWDALEELIGALEGGPAVAFSSGMAAIASVLELPPVGARVVAPGTAAPDCGPCWGAVPRPAAAGRCAPWT